MASKPAPKPITLTQTAAVLRNFLKIGAVALIVLMVGRVFFTSLVAYIKSITPTKQLPPTVGFRQMPPIPFPIQPNLPSAYKLETVGGQTPSFGDRAKVFFMPTASPSLTAVDRAKQKASSMGYVFEPEIIDSRTYRWTLTSPLLSTLEMDILTGTFTITTNWPSHPELLSEQQTINSSTLINRLKAFLQTADSLSKDLSAGPTRSKLVKAIGGQLSDADSLSDADFLQIDLYRNLIDDKYSSVSSSGKYGPIHALMSPEGTLLELKMQAYPIEYEYVHTYPLLPTSTAWNMLTNGQGFVANKGTQDVAVVRNITMAYYEPDSEFSYYRPVYVFEGDGGFIGMVEAIDPIWIQK